MTALELANRIQVELKANMPYDENKIKRKRPHMRDIALGTATLYGDDGAIFRIGNAEAELKAPQYHILNDAKYIHFPYKGTKKSKGSQALVVNKSQRDYGQWQSRTTKGGTQVIAQEYRGRNYRGARANIKYTENKQYYENKHFNYIENILDKLVPILASEMGGMFKRKFQSSSPMLSALESGLFDK